MIKKLLCLCLTLMIVVHSAAYAEETAENVNSNAAYENNKTAVDFIVAAGIAGGKAESDYGRDMNSKDFRQILINLGISDSKLREIDAFGIDYDEKGTVNKIEAAVPLVKLTGYDSQAINKGGYPSGYLDVAYSLGFFKNISAGADEALSAADVYRIVYNAVNAPYYPEITTPGKYCIDKNLTYLTEVLDIYKIEGTVNATPKSSMPGFKTTIDGIFKIGTLDAYIEAEKAEEYFASLVEAYCRYNEEDDEYTVITIDYHKKNRRNVLKSQYINDYSDYKYEYDDGTKNKSEKFKLSKSCEIVYNGTGVTRDNAEILNMKPDNGSVVLISNDNDNIADVAVINDYELYAVDEVNADNEFITTKSVNGSEKKKIDFSNIDIYSSNNKLTSLSALSEWNILNMAKNGQGGYSYAVISTETVTINTKSASMSNGYIELRIENENTVIVAKGLFSDLAAAKKKFTNASTYVGYLSADGLVCAWKLMSDTNYHTAFLAEARYFKSDETDEYVLRIKLYDIESDSGLTLYTAKKCKLEGERTEISLIKDALTASDGYSLDTLIRYKINANQEITDIDLPYDNNDSLEPVNEGGLVRVLNAPVMDASTGRRRKAWPRLESGALVVRDESNGGRTWIEGCPVSDSYIHIFIPENRTSFDDYYSKTKASDTQSVFEAYRIEGDTVLPTILLEYAGSGAPTRDNASRFYNNTALIGENDGIYLVQDISIGINDDDEPEYIYKLFGEKGEIERAAKYNEIYTELNVREGSLIRFAADTNDLMVAVEVIVDSDMMNSKNNWYSYTPALEKPRGAFGLAYKKYDGAVAVALKNPADGLKWNDIMYVNPSKVKTYVYDIKRRTVQDGRIEDVRTCYTDGYKDASRIFYYSYAGGGKTIFIFNGIEN